MSYKIIHTYELMANLPTKINKPKKKQKKKYGLQRREMFKYESHGAHAQERFKSLKSP